LLNKKYPVKASYTFYPISIQFIVTSFSKKNLESPVSVSYIRVVAKRYFPILFAVQSSGLQGLQVKAINIH